MIKISSRGTFLNIERFLENAKRKNARSLLNSYGAEGVRLLSSATPKDTGKTASSWSYTLTETSRGYNLSWSNTNVVDGVSVAILIQYGHGTRGGSYIQGIDYVNPAIRPFFERISADIFKEFA